jgi:hypothetical protein
MGEHSLKDISGVLYKITCATTTPIKIFYDKSSLLTMDGLDITDYEIIEYIMIEKNLFQFAKSTCGACWFICCEPDQDNEFYYFYDCKNLNQFETIIHGDLYINYLSLRNNLCNKLSWTHHGYKIIPANIDSNLINWCIDAGDDTTLTVVSKTHGEVLWNSVNETVSET